MKLSWIEFGVAFKTNMTLLLNFSIFLSDDYSESRNLTHSTKVLNYCLIKSDIWILSYVCLRERERERWGEVEWKNLHNDASQNFLALVSWGSFHFLYDCFWQFICIVLYTNASHNFHVWVHQIPGCFNAH